jgi:hypothetical protein
LLISITDIKNALYQSCEHRPDKGINLRIVVRLPTLVGTAPKNPTFSWAPVAHSYNPSYMGVLRSGGSQLSWRDSISKVSREKWTGGVA